MEKFKVVVNPIAYSAILDINTDISCPTQFEDLVDALLSLSEMDSALIRINTNGGNIAAALALLSAMKQCPAHLVGEIVGDCCSAGTFIFLACNEHVVNDHTTFMAHEASFGAGGKSSDIHATSRHIRKSSKILVEDFYDKFFTPEEIELILNGKEFWLVKDEVDERLARKFPHNYQEPLTDEDLQKMSKEDLIKLLTGQEVQVNIETVEEDEFEGDEESSTLEIVRFGTIEALKELADAIHVKYAHNISLDKLRERVENALK